jgi:hypothetical protein
VFRFDKHHSIRDALHVPLLRSRNAVFPNVNGVTVSQMPDVGLDPDLDPVHWNVREADDNTDTYGQEQSPDLQPGDDLL